MQSKSMKFVCMLLLYSSMILDLRSRTNFCSIYSINLCFQTIFLPVVGLVDPNKLKPGDLVGVNKDSYLILDTLPSEYDSRVKAMVVDEKPTKDYNDIGGLEKQVFYSMNVETL
jgi:hypothetical protein